MKKIIFSIILCCTISFGLKAKENTMRTSVSVSIPGAEGESHKINISMGGEQGAFTTMNGRANFTVELSGISFLLIEVDERRIIAPFNNVLFVEPGDSLNFVFNDLKHLGAATVECNGRGSNKINIMRDIFLAGQEFSKRNFNDSKFDSTEWRVNYNLRSLKLKLDLLSKNKEQISPEVFNVIETRYIIGDLQTMAAMIAKKMAAGKPELMPLALKVTDSRFTFILNKVQPVFAQAEYFDYYALLDALIKHARDTKSNINKDIFYAEKLDFFYSIFEKYLKGNPNRDFLLSRFIKRYVVQKGYNHELQICAASFLDTTNPGSTYYPEIKMLAEAEKQKLRNTVMPEFSLTDVSGLSVPLSKFKGKVVVLDFWFTGCNGCRDMKPYFEKIEKEFDNRKDIVFLSVSIDTDKEKWVNEGIGKYSSAQALQLYTDGKGGLGHPLVKYLNFSSYPSIFVIDKIGRVVVNKLNVPDIKTEAGSQEFVKILNEKLSANL